MTDQVEQLRHKGISAVALTSALSAEERHQVYAQIQQCAFRFIYVSPEKLATETFMKILRSLQVSLVVIDEAHCISEWGHQFRPQYLKISQCIEQLQHRPIIAAFTASATPDTAKDICKQLQLLEPHTFRQSVFRKNLSLHVIPCPTLTIQHIVMRRILKKFEGQSVIIYCATRNQTEDTAALLNGAGLSAAAYHAGLESAQRQRIQTQFIENQRTIICATTAFGMGVDKPNIRAVLHLNIPASLEGYYQEVGRAGRDGKPSSCYLLSLPSGSALQSEIISRSYPPAESSQHIIQYLRSKKVPVGKFIPLKDVTKVLNESSLETQLWITLKRGEERGWWQIYWQQKELQLLVAPHQLFVEWKRLAHQQLHQLMKLQRMRNFCITQNCRQAELVRYFEPRNVEAMHCKSCDNCTHHFELYPTEHEQLFFRKMHRQLARLERQKKLPFFIQLCEQMLACYQPQEPHELAWLGMFGKGWQKEWGTTLSRPDRDQHRQIRVDDSNDESQSKKSPPTF